MNLTIVTQHLPNHASLAAITSASKREYAARHGYGFHEQVGNYSQMSFDYQRIEIIYDILFNTPNPPDAVWWMGCDTLFTNHTVRVETLLKPEGKSLYWHLDVNGGNNDSVVLRNTDWTRRWLEMTLHEEPHYRSHCWQSQKCWQEHMTRADWRFGIGILHHPAINSYRYEAYHWPDSTPGNWSKGDVVLHLPGMSLEDRIAIFTSPEIQNAIMR